MLRLLPSQLMLDSSINSQRHISSPVGDPVDSRRLWSVWHLFLDLPVNNHPRPPAVSLPNAQPDLPDHLPLVFTNTLLPVSSLQVSCCWYPERFNHRHLPPGWPPEGFSVCQWCWGRHLEVLQVNQKGSAFSADYRHGSLKRSCLYLLPDCLVGFLPDLWTGTTYQFSHLDVLLRCSACLVIFLLNFSSGSTHLSCILDALQISFRPTMVLSCSSSCPRPFVPGRCSNPLFNLV